MNRKAVAAIRYNEYKDVLLDNNTFTLNGQNLK